MTTLATGAAVVALFWLLRPSPGAREPATTVTAVPDVDSGGDPRARAAPAVFARSSLAYATLFDTVAIYDIANPTAPTFLGRSGATGNPISDIVVSGTLAYLGVARGDHDDMPGIPGVWIEDVTVPAAPQHLGAVEIESGVEALALEESALYVAVADAGLMVVDVSNPQDPTVAAIVDTTQTTALDVAAGAAYLGDLSSGYASDLEIYEPGANQVPRLVGSLALTDTIRDLIVTGSTVFLATTDRLMVVDATLRSRPTLVGALELNGFLTGIDVVDGIAYVSSHKGAAPDTLYVVDVSAPAEPTLLGHRQVGVEANDVALGSGALLLGTDTGLQLVDVTTPTEPRVVADETDTRSYAEWVETASDYVYIGDSFRGVRVLDATSLPTLTEVARAGPPAHRMLLAGPYMYVSGYDDLLHVIDVTTPTAPADVGAVSGGGIAWAMGMGFWDNHVYLGTRYEGVKIIDVQEPTIPEVVATLALDAPLLSDLYVDDGRLYVKDHGGALRVFDVRVPSAPAEMGSVKLAGSPGDVVLAKVGASHLYVQNVDGGIDIVDVSDPSAPVSVPGFWDAPTLARAAVVSGSRFYAVSGREGTLVLDVSTPTAPELLGTLGPMSARDIGFVGPYVVVADGPYVEVFKSPEVLDGEPAFVLRGSG